MSDDDRVVLILDCHRVNGEWFVLQVIEAPATLDGGVWSGRRLIEVEMELGDSWYWVDASAFVDVPAMDAERGYIAYSTKPGP